MWSAHLFEAQKVEVRFLRVGQILIPLQTKHTILLLKGNLLPGCLFFVFIHLEVDMSADEDNLDIFFLRLRLVDLRKKNKHLQQVVRELKTRQEVAVPLLTHVVEFLPSS